jgi:S-DNA-T family DNA segregation ATPase FtsK/SpoIIIE
MWRDAADVFVGPDQAHAIRTLIRVQRVMDNRYSYLLAQNRRKIARGDGMSAILVMVDEIAYYSATVGDKKTQEQFAALLRDLVARGRAVGIIVIAATQRPSADIIPTSLRDIFAWRFAGRCTTDVSSDIVLGFGWASRGFSANTIAPEDQGVGWLIAEGGIPRLIKSAYLTDRQITQLAAYARWIRRPERITVPAGRPARYSTRWAA